MPSKSFGALAIGRPLLFCGDRRSAIAQWIEQYDIGWGLTEGNASAVAASITLLANNPVATRQMNERCQSIYRKHFSREVILDGWQRMLTELVTNQARIQPKIESR